MRKEYNDDLGVEYHNNGRIFLRRLTPDDVSNNYISWFKDEFVTEFLDSKSLSHDDIVSYIVDGARNRTHFMYGIFELSGRSHIGNLKIGPIQWHHLVSGMPCVIGDRSYWGKGLAKEAIALGTRIAFEVYGMRKLSGGIASGNVGSIKAYTGAGWVIEATLQGQHLINGQPHDRLAVSCFNPVFFPEYA